MGTTPTPHIGASKEQIAKTVLMPGDPLRAKFIAENFLENYECVNTVRNMQEDNRYGRRHGDALRGNLYI